MQMNLYLLHARAPIRRGSHPILTQSQKQKKKNNWDSISQ